MCLTCSLFPVAGWNLVPACSVLPPDMNLPWSTAVTLLHSLPGTHVVASDYQVDSCSITALVCQ